MPPESRHPLDLRRFVDRVLDLYRRHPHTTGAVRTADRALARNLYRHGIDLDTIDAALLLVAARRARSGVAPANPIRSLHYFLPAIRELERQPLDDAYLRYLKLSISRKTDHHRLA